MSDGQRITEACSMYRPDSTHTTPDHMTTFPPSCPSSFLPSPPSFFLLSFLGVACVCGKMRVKVHSAVPRVCAAIFAAKSFDVAMLRVAFFILRDARCSTCACFERNATHIDASSIDALNDHCCPSSSPVGASSLLHPPVGLGMAGTAW